MDSKMIAIIAAVVLVAAGGATFLVLNNSNDEETTFNEGSYNIIARVNAEGSGIYILDSKISVVDGIPTRNSTPFYSVSDGKYVVNEDNKAAWAGLKLGTPGPTSIQHIQIATLADRMGLEMVKETMPASSNPSNSIYFNDAITNADAAALSDNDIDGGILWEPQYSKIVAPGNSKGFVGLALTNDLFAGHTCCTVIGSHDYITGHSDITTRFLAGYIKSVGYLNLALSEGEGAKYNDVVSICERYTTNLEDAVIEAALNNITYLYADDETGSLSELTEDIESLAKDLIELGHATKDVDAEKLADAFVDDSYLKRAIGYEYSGDAKDNLRVAVINGDIHQIAIHIGIVKGYFLEYGLNITVSNGYSNGGHVADGVIGGQADIGFVGAPPATLKTINASLIKV